MPPTIRHRCHVCGVVAYGLTPPGWGFSIRFDTGVRQDFCPRHAPKLALMRQADHYAFGAPWKPPATVEVRR